MQQNEKIGSDYFHLGSYLLARIGSFALLHVNFVVMLLFLLNDPFNWGFNTIDAHEVRGKDCQKFDVHSFFQNLGWFMVWWIQHSGMARKAFKQVSERNVFHDVVQATGLWQHPLERPLFGTVSNIVLFNFLYRWRPITDCERWDIFHTSLTAWAISLPVIGLALFVILYFFYTFHDHVFGTARYKIPPGTTVEAKISNVFPYNMVRHPTAASFLYFFWVIPSYTPNHVYFATLWTLFILAGTSFEEKGLESEFGHEYNAYRQRVGQYFPRMKWFADKFYGTKKGGKKLQ